MDENEKSNSWDELIHDLGAQPDESAFERKQPEAQEIPPTLDWEEAEQMAEPGPNPSDWGGLAASLGIEVEDEPEPEVDTPAAEAVSEDTPKLDTPASDEAAVESEEVELESKSEAEEEPDAPTSAESAEPGPFGGFLAEQEETAEDEVAEGDTADAEVAGAELAAEDSEPDELPHLPSKMEEALSDTAWDVDAGEANAEDDADGQGISGEAARSAFDALFSDGASAWGSAFLDKPKRDNLPAADESRFGDDSELTSRADALDATSGDEPDQSEEEEDRPKRKRARRRRRGGRGRKSADLEASNETASDADEKKAEELAEDGDSPRPKRRRRRRSRGSADGGDGQSAAEDQLEEAVTGEDNDEGENPRRGRQRHRNIPTWSEAIGMIVDSNLEERAKSPSKPQSSRGGRGRGGRRRGGKKSEGK